MAVHLWLNEQAQFFDLNGDPLAGGFVFFYAAGGAIKQDTFTTSAGTIPNANPMTLDAAGRLAQAVWLTSGVLYKVGLAVATETDPPSNFISPWPLDNVSGINDTLSAITGEWITFTSSGVVVVPTYISATSFSVPGNQTATFTLGRALQIIDAGGTKNGFVKTATFSAGITTIVLDQNSDALANPISSVAYGIVNGGPDSSAPILPDTIPLRTGSADESKQIRFEIDGFTTATTRVITWPDNNITFNPAPAGGLLNGQIIFPAVAVPSADPNTLDDYEEGLWTPTLTFQTPGNLVVAYTSNFGTYTKIGRQVTLSALIQTSTFTHTTASGNLVIQGNTFTCANISGINYFGAMDFSGVTKASYTNYAVQMSAAGTDMVVRASGSALGLGVVSTADMPTGTNKSFEFTITFFV